MENKKKNDFKKLNWYLKFGCFLCGYKAKLMRECSEYSRKKLKRITAAMLIIMTLWFFIGYKFSEEYLKLHSWQAFLGGFVALFIVIQIERQIVLQFSKSFWIRFFRVALGVLMALIGSTIIDQIIFKDDIALANEKTIDKDVDKALKKQKQDSGKEIKRLDSLIVLEDEKIKNLENELSKTKPEIYSYTYDSEIVTTKTDSIYTIKKHKKSKKTNPRLKKIQDDIDYSRENIKNWNNERKEERLKSTQTKEDKRKELLAKKGFLKELELMFGEVLLNSWVAGAFYIVFFLFMLFLELLVLCATYGEKTDYEAMVEHVRNKKMPKNSD